MYCASKATWNTSPTGLSGLILSSSCARCWSWCACATHSQEGRRVCARLRRWEGDAVPMPDLVLIFFFFFFFFCPHEPSRGWMMCRPGFFPADRRADPLLQRGGGDREGGRATSARRCPRRRSTSTTTTRRDRTARAARDAGAVVRREPLQGKGNVVRRMFADIDADIYVMVDGDDTYDAAAAPRDDAPAPGRAASTWWRATRVDGRRRRLPPRSPLRQPRADRPRARAFGDRFTDMLSGYRVFSRRFVKSLPGAVRRASRPRPS